MLRKNSVVNLLNIVFSLYGIVFLTIGAFHLHQNSDKSHFCLSSTFMLKKDRSEIYLSFDVNGKHLLTLHSTDTGPTILLFDIHSNVSLKVEWGERSAKEKTRITHIVYIYAVLFIKLFYLFYLHLF